jgi:hypothetical protein
LDAPEVSDAVDVRIDHLVYAVPDLDGAVDDLEQRTGVRAGAGGRHTGLGTHNALLTLGPTTYLELIAPDPSQPAPAGPRPFGVDDVGGPRLAGWAITVDDIDAAIADARRLGYDPGDPIAMQRTTPDGTTLHWQLTLNAIAGGPLPFLIAWGDTPHPATTAPEGLRLVSFSVGAPDAGAVTATLHALGAELPVTPAPTVTLTAEITTPAGPLTLH